MNKVETITLMQTIIAMYPGTQIRMDEISVGVWHEMLKDLPAEVVGAACKRMCATLKYPPSIADIRGAVADAAKDAQGTLAAGEAWARVKKAVSLYGYYRPDAARKALGPKVWKAVEMIGGWQEVCAGDEDTSVRSAQFERRYNAMVAQESERVQIPEAVRADMARLTGPLMDKLMIGGAAGE